MSYVEVMSKCPDVRRLSIHHGRTKFIPTVENRLVAADAGGRI